MWTNAVPLSLHKTTSKRQLQFEELVAQQPQLCGALILSDRQLIKTLTFSDYVANSLLHFPELCAPLMQRGFISAPLKTQATYIGLQGTINSCRDEKQLFTCIRQFRRLQQMRLIWRDVNKLGDLQTTLTEITEIADMSVQLCLNWQHARLAKRYGEPMGRTSKEAQSLIVLAMGKQGAGELNLSSDIDLIYAYKEQGDTLAGEGQKSISNQEFFIKLGQALIQTLDKVTMDGFVYRVDMRLRPYGQSGPLVMNLSSFENYYHEQGRDWERYAMIKARAVTGIDSHIHDIMNILRPFSYRKYVDFGAFESLREMKSRIQQETIRRNLDNNVKLGSGGIREIEFIAQAFQLIRGGLDVNLQQPNIFKVLNYLRDMEFLPDKAVKELLEAYCFLRDAEHAIQGINDAQSQTLPSDDINQARIAWSMGYTKWADFFEALAQHRKTVTEHFDHIVAEEEKETSDEDTGLWQSIWLGVCDNCEHPANSDAIKTLLTDLRENNAAQRMQAIGKQRLDKTMPHLLKAIWETEHPQQTLERLIPLIEAILRRTAYLVLLNENPQALKHLVRLCEASPWVADTITESPILLDELLHPASLYNPSDKRAMTEDLNLRLLRIEEDDLEEQMDALRYFARAHKLQIAACEIAGVLPLMKVSDHLTWLAQTLLEKSMWLAWLQMVDKYGYPSDQHGEAVLEPEFLILGYGKLGGIELSYDSDLDMVFLHEGTPNKETLGERSLDNGVFYTRMGQRLIHILNTTTRAGQLYEVDMRLRPSGASGMIVTSLNAFNRYQQDQAWTWEHQALIRARYICGQTSLHGKYAHIRRQNLAKDRDLGQLRKEVREMRQKMRDNLGAQSAGNTQFQLKQDAGGIVDIEFMVQYLVLAHSAQHPSLLQWTDNVRLLSTLGALGKLQATQSEALTQAYIAYRSLAHRRALQNQKLLLTPSEFDQAELNTHIDTVKALWQEIMEH
ncbi:MAG: bifunctional [glutamate--ammonia ligase]-adenylyl-L-tyrosine phosphorylase/[glutamate--ammonia-ligase] adenylyltransferase [Bermanella sp.]